MIDEFNTITKFYRITEMSSIIFYNSFLIFRLLEEVSELEHSMRQLELKNENSEGSLRDMQVCIR